ncbi:MAG: hypothetical protein RR986_06885 [Longicatena sp.]
MRKLLQVVLALALLPNFMSVMNLEAKEETTSTKLDIQNFTLVDETISHIPSTKRGAQILFDSQNQIPNTPTADKLKIAGSTWQPMYRSEWGLPSFYIDLGAYYMITDIGYMDMNASPLIEVFQGDPFSWEKVGTLATNYYNTYRVSHFDSAKPTRYLRVISNSPDTGINELGIYGYKVKELSEANQAITAAKPASLPKDTLTSGQKIGANAFSDDPFTALAALGNVREYYNWSWLTDKNGQHFFNRIVNKDNYYRTLQAMGISVIPCLQMINDYFVGESEEMSKVKNTIPVEDGANTLNPASYQMHANAMYNFAARYGSNPNVDTSTLSVGDGDVQVGLGLLKGVESWNEQDKTWETKDSYFHPYEYAAMMSADYDGHEGTIRNAGVKKADPMFKLAMGGLANGDRAVEYLTLMKTWFDYNRTDGEFAVDIINYHDYITDTEAPEQSDFRENIQKISTWVEKNAPGRDIWLSEFDVVAKDKEQAGVDNHNNEEYAKTRADRLLRAFLVGEREGLDRSSMFMLRDEWRGVYYNSGLTTGKGDWDKKTSWYYITCATDTLKNADLIDVIEQDDVYIYTYLDRDTSEKIYAIWSPTADGSTMDNYSLQVGNSEKATLVKPTNAYKEGEKTILTEENGSVSVQVSETPIFVKVSGSDVPFDTYPQKRIEVQSMRLGELNGSIDTITFDNHEVVSIAEHQTPNADNFILNQFYHLFDEQQDEKTALTPWIKTRIAPTTEVSALSVHKERAYPYDCVLTFDDLYTISYIGMYDTYSTGRMDIIDDVSGELIYTSKLNTYNVWNLVPMTDKKVSTNRIRIIKYDDAKLNELAFYGYPALRRIGVDAQMQPGVLGSVANTSKTRIEIEKSTIGTMNNSIKNTKPVSEAFEKLFDEQSLLPINDQTAIKKGTSFQTNFNNVWGSGTTFPYDSIVTLKTRSTVSKASVYLGWGKSSGRLAIYNNETNELLADQVVEGNGKMIYLTFDHSVETSSLRIVKYDDRSICEVGFY